MNPRGFGDRQFHTEIEAELDRWDSLQIEQRDQQIESLGRMLLIGNRQIERYQSALLKWKEAYSLLADAYEQQQEADEVPA